VKKPARIVVHVGELVLHGFAPGDRHRIADALQDELGRLIAQRAPAERSAALVRAPGFVPSASPAATGRSIAASIHSAISERRR
jgi:hypothetical protein